MMNKKRNLKRVALGGVMALTLTLLTPVVTTQAKTDPPIVFSVK